MSNAQEINEMEAAMPSMPSDVPGGVKVFPLDKLTRPKVAIIGFTGHREEGMNLGDDWEVWGINELHRHHDLKIFQRWFEIHDRDDFEPKGKDKPGDPAHLKSLAGFNIPVYMHQHWDDIPPSVEFPKKAIEDFHNALGHRGGYQTSSISWEVAMALMMGAEEVGVFGVDMANNTEWTEQRNCLEYWFGVAESMTGKPVRLPDTCDLLTAFGQYGFRDEGNRGRAMGEARLKWMHEMHNVALSNLRKLEADKIQADKIYQIQHEKLVAGCAEWMGGIQDISYIIRSWFGTKYELTGNPTPDRTKDPMTGIMDQPKE